MSNLIKLVFATAVLLFSFNAFADPPGPKHSCANGWVMQGNINSNDVRCVKPSRTLRNKPACGVKRYRKDAAGIRDKCVRKNRPNAGRYWTQPRCIGGTYTAVSGYDQCRSGSRAKRFYCKQGWTLVGSTSGRGVIRCVQSGRTLRNKPACGVKRYRKDAAGIRDRCVRKNRPNARRYWTQPRCVGGTYAAVSGYDQCRGKAKSHHPWKR
jgi:hypothetical protein